MAVIFAVDRYVSSIYSELSKFIQGAEYVGHLTEFSSSLQNIVRKQYEDIKSTIRQKYWKLSITHLQKDDCWRGLKYIICSAYCLTTRASNINAASAD